MLGFILLAALASPATPTPTPAPAPGRAAAATMSKTTEPPPKGRSLAEVAKNVKLRFPANKPTVITNDSLKSLAAGAELTTAAPAPAGDASSSPSYTAAEEAMAQKKAYWQGRFFKAQEELSDLEAEQTRLTGEVARLERDFYARDDPYQRDNVIKPAWDSAVAKLREVQQRLAAARNAPDQIANEARRDGALPGWFREKAPATHGGESSGRQ